MFIRRDSNLSSISWASSLEPDTVRPSRPGSAAESEEEECQSRRFSNPRMSIRWEINICFNFQFILFSYNLKYMQLLLKLSHIWRPGWKVRRHVLQCEGPDPAEDEDKPDLGELPLETKTTSRVPEPEAAGDGDPGPGRVELGLSDLAGLGDSEPGLRVLVPGCASLVQY